MLRGHVDLWSCWQLEEFVQDAMAKVESIVCGISDIATDVRAIVPPSAAAQRARPRIPTYVVGCDGPVAPETFVAGDLVSNAVAVGGANVAVKLRGLIIPCVSAVPPVIETNIPIVKVARAVAVPIPIVIRVAPTT